MDRNTLRRLGSRFWSLAVGVVSFFGYVYSEEIKAILSRLSLPPIWFDPVVAIFVVLMIIGGIAFVLNEISRLRAKTKQGTQPASTRSVESGSVIPLGKGAPVRITVTYTKEDERLMKLGYQTLVRQELQQIEGQFNYTHPQPIRFKSWNEMQASKMKQLIDNDEIYRIVENIARILDEWNVDFDRTSRLMLEPNLGKLSITAQAIRKYLEKLREIGFLHAPIKVEVPPKRETLQRGLNELAVLDQAQADFPSATSTFAISNLSKINHQTVLEICRDLGARELLEVKEEGEKAFVRITARGQKVLNEAG